MEHLARRCGFTPWAELTKDDQKAVFGFIKTRWPALVMDASLYYWKESDRSSGEWISFNVDCPTV
jgi:hypothetical protein